MNEGIPGRPKGMPKVGTGYAWMFRWRAGRAQGKHRCSGKGDTTPGGAAMAGPARDTIVPGSVNVVGVVRIHGELQHLGRRGIGDHPVAWPRRPEATASDMEGFIGHMMSACSSERDIRLPGSPPQ